MSAPLAHAPAAPVPTAPIVPNGVDAPRGAEPRVPPIPTPVGSSEPSTHRSGYEHLAALFAERAELSDGHPRRETLRTELIGEYRPVAQHIARKYSHRGEHPEDLEQVATLGLILAVDRFEPERGVDFLSFAVPTISGEVLRPFRDRSTTIRMPRRLRALQGQIYEAAAELAQRHGRAARPSEIAAKLEVDLEVVLEGLAAQDTAHTSSLDEPARDDDGGRGDRGLDAALGWIEPEFDLVEHRQTLAPLLAALPAREQRILHLRFFEGMTQTEIGQQIGISQMHVSRLLTRTLIGLRHSLAAD